MPEFDVYFDVTYNVTIHAHTTIIAKSEEAAETKFNDKSTYYADIVEAMHEITLKADKKERVEIEEVEESYEDITFVSSDSL